MGQTKFSRGKEPSHVRIYSRQIKSIAWQHLSGSAVKVLLALASLERGENNGAVFLSDRKGAEMTGLTRNTVRKGLRELIELGFVYCSQRGAFSRKTPHAASYGLTWAAGQKDSPWRAPSHTYEDWRPNGNTRAQILTNTGANFDHNVETFPNAGAEIEPVEMETWLVSANRLMSEIGPHTSNQSQSPIEASRKHWKRPVTDPGTFLDRLRTLLAEHIAKSELGEQSRLANSIGCPGGTLSKFMAGKGLPEQYQALLAERLLRAAA
ncbi:MAG TPA: helix-turn-helix domain-containing protein [Novosphingobium sp.]|nr:helix-turn-helix domain-containing protein [Novosphingobium sp.]